MGRRDYAILMMLAKLGLRADEVATLTLDDIDWRASEMLVRAKGRQRARMPIPPDVGAAIVAYLRNGRPKSSCRRLFIRALTPHVGFASGCAITMIAKAALDRVDIKGCAHRGAHISRHSNLASGLGRIPHTPQTSVPDGTAQPAPYSCGRRCHASILSRAEKSFHRNDV
jgi:integrase